jgi:hypothetical protein
MFYSPQALLNSVGTEKYIDYDYPIAIEVPSMRHETVSANREEIKLP